MNIAKRILCAFMCAISALSLAGCELDSMYSGSGKRPPSGSTGAANGATAGDDDASEGSGLGEAYDFEYDMLAYFLDVGQADCCLIEIGDLDILIDGGNRGDSGDIIAFLEYLDIPDIDIVIATHPHEDHIGGLPDILDRFDVSAVYMPYVEERYMPTTKIYERFLTAIMENGVEAIVPEEGEILCDYGGFRLECLYGGGLGTDDYNTYSIVCRAVYGETEIMLTGDADREVESYILSKYSVDRLDCDILKAGHHGSRTASGDEWLAAVSPEIAVIPCEAGNSYGHPHAETIVALDGVGADILDMRKKGTVLIQSDGSEYSVFTNLTGDYPLGSDDYDGIIRLP